MRPRLPFLAPLVRRPRLLAGLLVGLALVGAGAYVGGPQLSAWRHRRAAEDALERFHTDEARGHLEACLETWPRDPRTRLLAARAARQAGDLEGAYRHLREYGDLPGRDEEARDLELRLLRAASGDVDPVEEYLQGRVEKGDPQGPLILEALLAGYLRTYRQREALLCVALWLERQPDSAQALFCRGRVAQRVHDYRAAARDFGRVVELDPDRDDARLSLVQCLLEVGEHGAALEHLDVLRARRPDDPEVLSRMAFAHGALGRPGEAARLLDAVLDAHPGHVPALRGRGEVALQTGHPDAAERWLRRALAATPYDRQANLALEQSLERQGKRAEARKVAARRKRLEADLLRVNDIATRLMPARPRDAGLHCELGTILLRIGHQDVGERWLLSALALDPACAAAHRALADYYRGRGDADRADRHGQLAQAPP
jgi:tetratricopeptide (TPR) repeat protein